MVTAAAAGLAHLIAHPGEGLRQVLEPEGLVSGQDGRY
nr:MAG TPA: hypothetical protein [Caudoviricetes sp.]